MTETALRGPVTAATGRRTGCDGEAYARTPPAFQKTAGETTLKAADPIMPAPITPASLMSSVWDGFYAGVNAGHGWSEAYNAAGVIPGPLDQINGLSGGARLRFNIQHDAVVFGVEADIQASGISQDLGAPAAIGVDYFGTVRGRIGVDVGNGVLPYLTGVGARALSPRETIYHVLRYGRGAKCAGVVLLSPHARFLSFDAKKFSAA